jgi:hypothetical protein
METIINYISIGIGLVLSIIGIILQIKSSKKKEIAFSIKSNNLISSSSSMIENLTVLYKDYKVENLTASKILFYNRGNETISKQDLETIDRFSIKSTDNILDARLIKMNYPPNNIKLQHKTNEKSIYIDFDYLDQNQGSIIQIIHTGISSDNLQVEGSIKGMKKLTKIPQEQLIRALPISKRGKKILALSIVIAVIGYFIFSQTILFDLFMQSKNIFVGVIGMAFIIIVMVSWLLPIFVLSEFMRRLLKSSKVIPIGLEEFME